LVGDVVEESAELRAAQLNAGVSNDLDQPFEIGLSG
jgi:hypothetical protein